MVVVDMVVKDCQPFSIDEDKGFKAFVHKLDPTYVWLQGICSEEWWQKSMRREKKILQLKCRKHTRSV